MHRHAGFAAARAADHAHHGRIIAANRGVLLRLNRGNDLAHVAAGRAGQNIQQHFIIDGHLRIHVIFQLPLFHAILALERHFADDLAARTIVGNIARHGIIIQAAHRRAPIVHQQMPLFILQTVQADNDLFDFLRARFDEIHAGEEGVHQHPAVALRHFQRKFPARGEAIDFHGKLFQILRL